MKMACFMDERGGQVGLSMKSGCFMDGWGIEEGVVHENGLFHGQQTSVVDEGFGKVQVVEEKWRRSGGFMGRCQRVNFFL